MEGGGAVLEPDIPARLMHIATKFPHVFKAVFELYRT